MTISSLPSTVTGKSEGLTNLERGNEPSPITGKGSDTEPSMETGSHTNSQSKEVLSVFLVEVCAAMCPETTLLRSQILLSEFNLSAYGFHHCS